MADSNCERLLALFELNLLAAGQAVNEVVSISLCLNGQGRSSISLRALESYDSLCDTPPFTGCQRACQSECGAQDAKGRYTSVEGLPLFAFEAKTTAASSRAAIEKP